MLIFNVRHQEIRRIDKFSPTEKSLNYLMAEFNFKTADWNNTVKTAVFKNLKTKETKDALLDNDHCLVPWEVLIESAQIEVSVYGVKGETIITSDTAVYELKRTLHGGTAAQQPTPDVYAQILAKLTNIDGGTFEDWME